MEETISLEVGRRGDGAPLLPSLQAAFRVILGPQNGFSLGASGLWCKGEFSEFPVALEAQYLTRVLREIDTFITGWGHFRHHRRRFMGM